MVSVPAGGVHEPHVRSVERLEAGRGAQELAVLQSVHRGRAEGHKQSGVRPESPPHQHGAVLAPERSGAVHAAHEAAL